VLRIGGRLKNADLPDDMKHSIILDGNSIFLKLLVRKHHEKAFHQEMDTVINELKGTYYIFNHGRSNGDNHNSWLLYFGPDG
jgi:hypothetical protein